MDDKRDEKIGRAIVGITWLIFAAKFILIVTVLALVVLYFIGKPLWLAPLIAIGVFAVYRLCWRLVWLFIEWAGKQ
ncbi:MAG: hypothetical protein K6F87_08415 [Lachnospiraceae bacterium]|nr:hypothetical protein [Lachnospiraceae bacterium]